MRAERARNFLHFHIQKLLFLSIFFWYFRNIVGTNDLLVGLHVPTDSPPPLATLVHINSVIARTFWVLGGTGEKEKEFWQNQIHFTENLYNCTFLPLRVLGFNSLVVVLSLSGGYSRPPQTSVAITLHININTLNAHPPKKKKKKKIKLNR